MHIDTYILAYVTILELSYLLVAVTVVAGPGESRDAYARMHCIYNESHALAFFLDLSQRLVRATGDLGRDGGTGVKERGCRNAYTNTK